MKNKWLYLIGGFVLLLIIKSAIVPNDKRDVNTQYESEWQSSIDHDHFVDISKVLVSNEISGCGEYYIKDRSSSEKEYLIACTSDGFSFKYHIVWLNTNKIQSVDSEGINPPNKN